MDCTISHTHYEISNFSNCSSDLNKKTPLSAERKSSFSSQNAKAYKTSSQDSKNSSILLNDTKDQSKAINLLSSGKDNHLVLGRSFDRSHNSSNGIYDFGGAQETNEDSGIEMLRAFSSNSSNSGRFTPVQSCGSSLVSYSSEPEGDRCSECGSESSEKSRMRKGRDPIGQCSNNCWKSRKTYDRCRVSRKTNSCDCEGTSESCSETSSTHEAATPDQLNRSTDFKRSVSNRLQGVKKCENGKSSVLYRSESSTRDSFDKTSVRSHSSLRSSSTAGRINSSSRSFSSNRNAKSVSAGKCEAKPSKTRTEDGRRSSSQKNQVNGTVRVASIADPSRKSLNAMSCSMTSSFCGGTSKTGEGKSDALDKYGTLPRRTKKKLGESLDVSTMHASYSRSHSVTREPSLNRAATLRRQQSKEKESASNRKSLPPYPRPRRGTCKITIYHEVSVQTVITGEDISSSSAGVFITDKRGDFSLQKESKGIQTEGKEKLKKMEDGYSKQREELEATRKENEKLKLEKENTLSRILKLLGLSESKETDLRENWLDELEKHFQAVGLTVIKQQEELSELRHYKLIANKNLEQSLATQKNLLQQQQEIEEEYSELQEFLQAEKTALSESLIDTEEELKRLRDEVSKNQALIEQQQEECKHLVRICEQRRQENLSLEAKLAGLDQRSRDVLVQQGAAVSAAAVALSGLGARLDSLVEQLCASYNINDQDLEDVFYQNELYVKSESCSPDDTLSLPRSTDTSNQKDSFCQIILGAIRNTAHSPVVCNNKSVETRKLSEPFFCIETEPLLNFENCLEENPSLSNFTDCDGGLDDKDESKESGILGSDVKSNCMLTRSDSLQNLSEAILNRQLAERNEKSVALDEIIPMEVNSLVDQTVDVDNLVTKLLKVIRIIQGQSDVQKDKLQKERANLTDELRQEKLSRQETERNIHKIQLELTEARCQINLTVNQLEEAKALYSENRRAAVAEMQKRFALIDTALGALNSAQHIIEQCPQLARLQNELKDCNHQRTQSDVNANPENKYFEDVKCNGAVLTTAV